MTMSILLLKNVYINIYPSRKNTSRHDDQFIILWFLGEHQFTHAQDCTRTHRTLEEWTDGGKYKRYVFCLKRWVYTCTRTGKMVSTRLMQIWQLHHSKEHTMAVLRNIAWYEGILKAQQANSGGISLCRQPLMIQCMSRYI
jgi:hypothetical protein